MESEKYWKYHLSRSWIGTKKELNKHRYIEIGIAVGGTFFIAIKYLFFDSMLKQTIIEFSGLIGTLFIAFIAILVINRHKSAEDIFAEGQEALSSSEKKVRFLEEQQKPKLQIGFDLEKFSSCLDDTSNAYEDPQTGKTVVVAFSQKWRIFVYNPSITETIKNVEVKLIDISKCLLGSARNLPEVHLKFTHDNKREQRFADIHPKSHKFVDVIECYMKSTQFNENIFHVQHIEKNENGSNLTLFYNNIDKEDCTFRIEAEGENITCKPKDFIIGLKDSIITMRPAQVATNS